MNNFSKSVFLAALLSLSAIGELSAAAQCNGKADLWFANDESGSVNGTEFNQALDFIYQVSDQMTFNSATGLKAGITGWASSVSSTNVIVPITDQFSDPDDTGLISNSSVVRDDDGIGVRDLYRAKVSSTSGTRLDYAATYLAGLINDNTDSSGNGVTDNGRRSGVPQLAVILTDASASQLTSAGSGGGSAWSAALTNLRNAGPGGTKVVIMVIDDAATAYNNNSSGAKTLIDGFVASGDSLFVGASYALIANPAQTYIDGLTNTICDNTQPTVDIQGEPVAVNSLAAYPVTFEFSTNVTGFALADISVTNGAVSNLQAVDGNTYTANITPNGNGNITIDVVAAAAQSGAGLDSLPAVQAATIYDIVAPTVDIQNEPVAVNTLNAYPVTFEFSENVSNFNLADISVTNGTASNFQTVDGNTYTADITPNGNGNILIDVNATVAQDIAGNGNTAAAQAVTTYDTTPPTVDIQNEPAVIVGLTPYTVTFEFSENVSGFTAGDITVTNGAASNFQAVDGNTYTAVITPNGNGNILIDVNATVAQDAAGNSNTAAAQAVTTFTLVPDDDNDGIPDSEEGTGDTDGDGIPDYQDPDSDNDGIPDTDEAAPDPTNPSDTDGDGRPNHLDNDSDNDGLPDALEVGADPNNPVDSDGDGTPDYLDRDSDNDTIPDAVENTGASGNDSDNDGIDDTYDVDNTGGTDANNDGVDDNAVATDADGDTIPNYLDLDSDNDTIPDVTEDDVADGVDTDNDGVDDAYDVDSTGGTDADNDGVDDAVNATDTDSDSYPDYLDLDSDSDGIPDQLEAGYDASAVNFTVDADRDGMPDAMDADTTAGTDADNNGVLDNLQPVNTDGDAQSIDDFRDLDSDDDGLLDTEEAGLTDQNEDGLVDGADANGDGIVDAGAATAPVRDTDNDGSPDYTDLESTNPANNGAGPFDVDGDPDTAALDADNNGMIDDPADLDLDGILDVTDRAPNVFGASGDSDNDGVSDTDEIGPDPLNPVDTDNDGTPDYLDTDSDNDGFPDALENVGCPLAADPADCNADGTPDRLQNSELETAVTGAGGMGLLSLLMLLPLLFYKLLNHGRASTLSAAAMLLVSAQVFTAQPAMAEDAFYAGRNVVKNNEQHFYRGWYAGLGAGTTHVDPEGNANGFETDPSKDSSSGFKIYAGQHFKPNWSWEVSYADLGEAGLQNPTRPALFDAVSADVGTPEIDYSVPAGWVLYHVREPNEDFNFHVKAGVSFISNSSNDPRIGYDKKSSAQLALGLGLQWRFTDRFFARLEHDSYDRDASYTGLSVGMYFGGDDDRSSAAAGKSASQTKAVSSVSPPVAQTTAATTLGADICGAFAAAVEGVTFRTNSANLTKSSKAVLQNLAQSLTANPGVSIEIQAHTDSDGSAEYNQVLSEKRAQSVMNYLTGHGVTTERMSVGGYGETQPIADNTTREGKARNRRVEFIPAGASCK